MEKWKKFELECTEYLNKKYGNKFIHQGFSNSTVSDIKYENNSKTFYIEAKMPSAQSGQFVLLPDYENKEFIFSPRNKTEQDENTDFIIQYMNNDFEKFSKIGTSGEDIDIDQSIFKDWIINTYRQKKVKFIITKGSDYIILPLEKYGNYFSISAKYRIKRSGSNPLPKYLRNDICKQLNQLDIKYTTVDNSKEGLETKKFYINSKTNVDRFIFPFENNNFMLSFDKDDIYEVRKLGKTQNPNVIFSIYLLKEQDPADLKNFISNL